jgi:hypothetical protein
MGSEFNTLKPQIEFSHGGILAYRQIKLKNVLTNLWDWNYHIWKFFELFINLNSKSFSELYICVLVFSQVESIFDNDELDYHVYKRD